MTMLFEWSFCSSIGRRSLDISTELIRQSDIKFVLENKKQDLGCQNHPFRVVGAS